MNLEGYLGGFAASDLERLLDLMMHNPSAWSASLADLVAGGRNPTSTWLAKSFCSVAPDCLPAFARATFLVDDRSILPRVRQPCLVLSSARDALVPPAVHDFMMKSLPQAVGEILPIAGHAAHLTHPALVAEAIRSFVA
jgi:sigma-B regulation protein RsbQ